MDNDPSSNDYRLRNLNASTVRWSESTALMPAREKEAVLGNLSTLRNVMFHYPNHARGTVQSHGMSFRWAIHDDVVTIW
jgi:hypothetical protein